MKTQKRYFVEMKETTAVIRLRKDLLTAIQDIISLYTDAGYECYVKKTKIEKGSVVARVVYWKLQDNLD